MKLFLLILGIVVVALNILLWYSKKHSGAEKDKKRSDKVKESDSSEIKPDELLSGPEGDKLKEAAAAELGIPVEQLNRMSADEIELLAAEKNII